ncbi:hypothetical protein AB6A40_003187 [Gnathostoma spinigerum]|uniref:G-patch domain-containing protein n=1 Tax=Gnathostoma spinigerum TaxID=75299 RepID=A0ABD6E8S7_9BILA
MAELVIFGTQFEDLSDEEKDAISHRPRGIEEQTVRDEKGRRRFHGAFTGGFSAGYYNTAGSKEGWTPNQYRSSVGNRVTQQKQHPEDFMDEEDLNEFGIASRRVKLSDNVYTENAMKGPLAWEREANSALEKELTEHLQNIIRPASDSIGVRLLKKMGWREGQGIGPKMSRRNLERERQMESRLRGENRKFDHRAVKEVDEMAPSFEFSPDDIPVASLVPLDGVHGLGYVGLDPGSLSTDKYGQQSSTLKTKSKSRGIRGQAFGVGAFEDEDDDIYTNTDFTQYDFSIGSDDRPSTSEKSYDDSFVMASKRQSARLFFEAPRLPTNFRPKHQPIPLNIGALPEALRKIGEKMNHVQRAQFLGEVDANVVKELIKDADRRRIEGSSSTSRNSSAQNEIDENLFEDEPMKQARFKQYVSYLKRGLSFPKPPELTRLEWDQEVTDFQNALPVKLRSLLPEVQARQMPLVKSALAAPIADILKSKFTSSVLPTHKKHEGRIKDEDRLSAVKMKMFGDLTRQSFEWHPAKDLAKWFNIPDPYPSSMMVGVPHLQKIEKTETLFNLGLPGTSAELSYKNELERRKNEMEKETIMTTTSTTAVDENCKAEEPINEAVQIQKPPDELLNAIFGSSESESGSDSEQLDAEHSQSKEPESVSCPEIKQAEAEQSETHENGKKFKTVMDIIELDDSADEYGPLPPPEGATSTKLPTFSVVRQHREECKERRERRHHRHKHENQKLSRSQEKKKKRVRKRRNTDIVVGKTSHNDANLCRH